MVPTELPVSSIILRVSISLTISQQRYIPNASYPDYFHRHDHGQRLFRFEGIRRSDQRICLPSYVASPVDRVQLGCVSGLAQPDYQADLASGFHPFHLHL